MKAILKTIPAAMLLAFGAIHISSNAAVISNVCQVNQVNACESRGTEIPASSILTIRGYAFDPATGVKPGNTQGAYILVRNEDTLTDYKLALHSPSEALDALECSLTALLPYQHTGQAMGFFNRMSNWVVAFFQFYNDIPFTNPPERIRDTRRSAMA